jgi:hypothetical protein
MNDIRETVENEMKWTALKKKKSKIDSSCRRRNTERLERGKYQSGRIKVAKNSVQYIAQKWNLSTTNKKKANVRHA